MPFSAHSLGMKSRFVNLESSVDDADDNCNDDDSDDDDSDDDDFPLLLRKVTPRLDVKPTIQ